MSKYFLKIVGKMNISIIHNAFWEIMEMNDIVEVKLGNLKSIGSFRTSYEMGHFLKTINDDYNGIVMPKSMRKALDKINSHVFP